MTEEEMTARQRAAETKRRRTRRSIVLAALDLYGDAAEGDYTREQIAEAADVSVATLYNHFAYKYDILQAAHAQLLAPVIQPIVGGNEDGTYNPSDPIEELLRYMYAVNKLSHEHLALTTAMIKACFEVPVRDGYLSGRVIGSHISDGMGEITFDRAPFRRIEGDFYQGGFKYAVSSKTDRYHMRSMLLELRDCIDSDAPLWVTKTAADELLPAILAGFETSAITEALSRLDTIRSRVDEWYDKMKQREERDW